MAYILIVDDNDLFAINLGAQEIPTKFGAPLINKINFFINEQKKPEYQDDPEFKALNDFIRNNMPKE